MFTSAELHAMNRHDVIPPRAVRKAIFSHRLWRPRRQRLHAQRILRRGGRRPFCTDATVKIGCVNARSASNKTAILCRTIIDEELDIFVITETCHEDSSSTVLKQLCPPGFRSIDVARPVPAGANVHTVDFQNHGGLTFIHRSTVGFRKRVIDCSVKTFEFLCGDATLGSSHFVLLGIYCPGSQPVTAAFFDELSAVFEQLMTLRHPVVVCGDFNVHVDQADNPHAVRLAQLLHAFGCTQHVVGPTHTAGHTLDLVITKADTDVCDVCVGGMISDHALVKFTLRSRKSGKDAQYVDRRAWRRLSRDEFAADLTESRLCRDLNELEDLSVDDLVRLYDQQMTRLLNVR